MCCVAFLHQSAPSRSSRPAGCLPAGALAAYRSKFDALPTHDWRLVHRKSLKALVDQGDWSGWKTGSAGRCSRSVTA